MRRLWEEFSATILVGMLAVLVVVGCVYGYLALYRDAAPKFEAAHREVFENTPSFVQGKVTHLTRLRLDYRRTTDRAVKESLREMILTEASTVDPSKLPAELRRFIEGL